MEKSLSTLHQISSLKLAAWLSLLFFSVFWVLDFYIVPNYVYYTGALRLYCAVYSLFLIILIKFRRRYAVRYYELFSMILAMSIIYSISVMCWLHEGYESPYYAGINTVLLVVGMVFSWSLKVAIIFNLSVYLFYMSPLILGLLPVNDSLLFLTHQFFLVTTILLTFISQRFRVAAEIRDRRQRLELKSYLLRMRTLAIRDSLTNLYNRRHVLDLGEVEFERCRRYKRPFAALIIDIDNFKKINDTYTHKAGDEVIQAVSEILTKSIRTIDLVGRYGGEEFLVLLPEYDVKVDKEIMTNRILGFMREKPIMTFAGPIQVGLSIGVCGKELDEKLDLETLIWRADVALYEAKTTGKDKAVSWSDLKNKPEVGNQ